MLTIAAMNSQIYWSQSMGNAAHVYSAFWGAFFSLVPSENCILKWNIGWKKCFTEDSAWLDVGLLYYTVTWQTQDPEVFGLLLWSLFSYVNSHSSTHLTILRRAFLSNVDFSAWNLAEERNLVFNLLGWLRKATAHDFMLLQEIKLNLLAERMTGMGYSVGRFFTAPLLIPEMITGNFWRKFCSKNFKSSILHISNSGASSYVCSDPLSRMDQCCICLKQGLLLGEYVYNCSLSDQQS